MSAAVSCMTVNGIRQFYVEYPCGHYAAFTQNKEFEEIVVELLPGDEDILLSELFESPREHYCAGASALVFVRSWTRKHMTNFETPKM